MKVLIVGSGGREHALAWKIAQSSLVSELHAAPGNPGIARLGHCHPVRGDDAEALLGLCRQLEVDLVVVGPEAPLVGGLADVLRSAGVAVFGPTAAAARIEGSKSFAKEVMRAAGVPTAAELEEPRAPCVIKADGLAAGKGVFVCRTQSEADSSWRRASALGDQVVVEELLEGEEVSLFAICDGVEALPLPAAQDFKRLRDGDDGPNTGGMGSLSPPPTLAPDEVDALVRSIHREVLGELASRKAPFLGLLYAGLMLTEDGPRVLEFNCRFGDPETQAIVPRMDGDLLAALAGAARGSFVGAGLLAHAEPFPAKPLIRGSSPTEAEATPFADLPVSDETLRRVERERRAWISADADASVTVVLASSSYPHASDTGTPIAGIAEAEAEGALVFHAGTALRGSRLMSAGGRVLNVTATGESLAEARDRAYAAVELIDFPGAHYRRDIAARAAAHVHS